MPILNSMRLSVGIGALRSAMGVCGAQNLREFQRTEMVIAPAIQSEGKLFQQAQQVGMGT